MTFFCPACFAEISEATVVCPRCGEEVEAWSRGRSYADRLAHALNHPLAEVRMAAIVSLGNRGASSAAEALVACAFRHPADIVQALEIVRSVTRLEPGGQRDVALEKLGRHPASAVRAETRALANGDQRLPEDAST